MLCPNCGRDQPDSAAFCANCGRDFPDAPTDVSAAPDTRTACPSCGAKNEPDALICSLCGAVFRTVSATGMFPKNTPPPAREHASGAGGSSASKMLSFGGCGALVLLMLAGGGWFGWRMWHSHVLRTCSQDGARDLTAFDTLTEALALHAGDAPQVEQTLAELATYRDAAKALADNPALAPADRERIIADVFGALIEMHDLCDAAWVEDTAEEKLTELAPKIAELEKGLRTPHGTLQTVIEDGSGRKLKPSEYFREKMGDDLAAGLEDTRTIFVATMLLGQGAKAPFNRKLYGIPYTTRLMAIAADFGHSAADLSQQTLFDRFGLEPAITEEE